LRIQSWLVALIASRNPWYDKHFCNKRWSLTRELLRLPSGNNSVVECDLAKVEVAGSNPVSRSIYWRSAPPAPCLGSLHSLPLRRVAPFRSHN
jgi:hypothetical protein